MDNYTGYIELQFNESKLSNFYSNKLDQLEGIKDNQYIIIKDQSDKIIDYAKVCDGKIARLEQYPVIHSDYAGTIKPRNPYQHLAMDLLKSNRPKVKLLKGVYGSGKDYLMLYEALDQIKHGLFDKIVYVRPNISVANIPDIGALPGTADEKLAWTLAPIQDKLGGEYGVMQLVSNGQLEMVPLCFIRGRSFENSLVYVCEGQNATTEIVKLIISRIGEGSELWINADTHQADKHIFEVDNGINRMIQKLSGDPLFGYVYLPITERSSVARLADLLDD